MSEFSLSIPNQARGSSPLESIEMADYKPQTLSGASGKFIWRKPNPSVTPVLPSTALTSGHFYLKTTPMNLTKPPLKLLQLRDVGRALGARNYWDKSVQKPPLKMYRIWSALPPEVQSMESSLKDSYNCCGGLRTAPSPKIFWGQKTPP